MSLGRFKLPEIKNAVAQHYRVGSAERVKLKAALAEVASEHVDIPCVVGGKEFRTDDCSVQVMPSKHAHELATFHNANEEVCEAAVRSSVAARDQWQSLPLHERLSVFKKAGDLLESDVWRHRVMAATMLGQSKNVWQAEIDAAMETIDFFRFSARYAEELCSWQPVAHDDHVWNRMEYRPLEGFVLAVTPFNFTAIAANLPTAAAVMGNTVVWKPSSSAALSSYRILQVLREAGLPDGVINFVPMSGANTERHLVASRHLGGVHFTGSTPTFNRIWQTVSSNLMHYRSYPRLVGETGGKNFAFVHSSAHYENALNCVLRGAFEYQGQKCSATSRLYVPRDLWEQRMRADVVEFAQRCKVGQPTDFDSFMCAVIDRAAFDRIQGYIETARASPTCEIIAGGQCDDSEGYFVQPTIVETSDPYATTMREEIFGPVLTVYPYDVEDVEATLNIVNQTSPYALTGAIFATDRYFIDFASKQLRDATGNFYINDKSTGAVVGQQPFGGGRASGTNDKAGHALNLLRWTSVRSIKENSVPALTVHYPHEDEP
jgi:1-pyrroline-5-carboxylate dehydrogenase